MFTYTFWYNLAVSIPGIVIMVVWLWIIRKIIVIDKKVSEISKMLNNSEH